MLSYIKKSFSRKVSEERTYLAAADGIRFFATIHVIFGHIGVYMMAYAAPLHMDQLQFFLICTFANPGLGLNIFFVLSGFLLVLPFANYHIHKTHRPSLLQYFLRRLIRLELPYILALTISSIALILIVKKYDFDYLLPRYISSLFYANHFFYGGHPEPLPIAWSLETEVQFYILVPLLSYLFKLPKLLRRIVLLTLIIGIPLLVHYTHFHYRILFVYYAQYFLAGILVVDFYLEKEIPKLSGNMVSLLAIASAILVFLIIPHLRVDYFTDTLYYPLPIALFIFIVVRLNALPRIFTNEYLRIVGCMCYSIYLFHYMIISKLELYTIKIRIGDYMLPNLLLQILLVAPAILIISGLYFKFVERPCMYSSIPKRIANYINKKV